MYIQGFVIPVPEGNKDAYRDVAEKFWPIAKDYGATGQVECWEVDVPDGETTDFRRAVKAESGEKVVFSWLIWKDKATFDAGHEAMMTDERMATEFGGADGSGMPFDGKRMVFGGFEPIFWQEA